VRGDAAKAVIPFKEDLYERRPKENRPTNVSPA
jgi:hypothetical protein